MTEQLLAGSKFHHASQIHDRNTSAHEADYSQIMGNEQIAQTALILHVPEQVQHLSLNGSVKSGNRLVAYHKRGVGYKRPGYRDSLTLPPENSCGKSPACSGRNSTFSRRLRHLIPKGRGGQFRPCHAQRLGYRGAHAHPRIQRGKGVLKYHLHPPARSRGVKEDRSAPSISTSPEEGFSKPPPCAPVWTSRSRIPPPDRAFPPFPHAGIPPQPRAASCHADQEILCAHENRGLPA